MQPRHTMRGLVPSLLLLVSSTWNHGALAHPYAKDEHHDLGYGYLMDRDCHQYCGYNNQYCCSSGSSCYTSDGIAGCAATAGGGVAWYTTTWTETETFTSTFSSYYPAGTGSSGAACTPPAGSGEIACGSICCASWQYCAYEGQCSSNAGATATAGTTVMTTYTSNGQTITTQYSAPYRVTSGASAATTTETGVLGSATSTSNATVVGASTAGNLSGGAIAGIVIGTLAGVVILLLLCACCVVRGLWHTILGMLAPRRKPKRTTETIIEEERYSRRGSVHSRRDRHGSWYGGGGGGRPSTVAASRKEKTGGGGWLGLGAAAGTLMLLLGLKRDQNRRKNSAAAKPRPAMTDYSSTYYSDSYTATTPSSRSSDRRTRDTRRTRETRTTRVSQGPSRVDSRAPSRR